uniref:Probable arginine--tRNA ligase, cytoplasmic n=1 Tax=Plectus sambesii TaxID=2011161 RepID=A0A914W0Y8_9BILA
MKPEAVIAAKADGVADFDAATSSAEIRLIELERLMTAMSQGQLTDELLEHLPELAALKAENERLKFRATILKHSIHEEEAKSPAGGAKKAKKEEGKKGDAKNGDVKKDDAKKNDAKKDVAKKQAVKYVQVEDYAGSIIAKLTALFAAAMKAAYPVAADVGILITEATRANFGDYQFNSAMAVANTLTKAGQKTNPRDVAQNILAKLEPSDLIEKTEVAGPGFVNIFLNRATIAKRVGQVCMEGVKAVLLPRVASRRAVVDFSSPNVAKEMHVGHLRSTIIGDSICRLLEHVHFDVLRINHIGDWGTQFGMLIAHLQERFPNFLTETPPIGDLQAFYKESKKRFDEDEKFKARAYQCVVKLQAFDADIVKAWKLICDESRKDFERIYERLDIKVTERGESFYQSRMGAVIKELTERGFLKEEDGRKIMFATGQSVPLTVVKSDGGNTYDTSDLAAIKQRLNEEKADWLIYVVDVGQSMHLETIYAAARDLSWYDDTKKRVEHVGFGLVLGEDKKKFKTRSGDTVRLTDLLNEGLTRSLAKLKEKERDKVMTPEELKAAQEAIAYGCIKYADLSHNRTQDYVFSFDRMLDDRGNTAVYLLYAYTRIRSIARVAEVSSDQLKNHVKTKGLTIDHPAEFKLAKTILKFSDCILSVLDSLMMHQLCEYLYELATTFHDFYSECYVIEKDKEGKTVTIRYDRLVLCEVTADVMADCFNVLGIRTLEKM